jgi:hypothetical protein
LAQLKRLAEKTSFNNSDLKTAQTSAKKGTESVKKNAARQRGVCFVSVPQRAEICHVSVCRWFFGRGFLVAFVDVCCGKNSHRQSREQKSKKSREVGQRADEQQ